MDVRSLACFVAVAEKGHFRRAAADLNITQPTLSQRIRVLEDEVGAVLFVRDRRRVELTPAGQAFLEPARTALANARLAVRQAREATRGRIGRLRLGFTVIAFYGMLPAAVREFRAAYPDVSIELIERDSPALEAALLADEIDLGVLHPPLGRSELNVHRLADEGLMLALPSEHRLAAKRMVSMVDLAGEPFLISPRTIGPSFYDRLIAHFQAHGTSPNIIQEVRPMPTLVGLVAAGVGIGFVTAGIARAARPGVTFRPVRPTPPSLPLAVAWLGRQPSRPGQIFLDIVAKTAKRDS